MIANLTLSLLLTLGTSMVLSQSVSTKEFQHYYQVAYDFDINPPELEYGYPWWYDADSLPVTGIIFLKNDLDITLEKLNDTAWVAEVSDANAKEIAASIMADHVGLMPKYLIVPDSSLTFFEIRNFIDTMIVEWPEVKFEFADKKGRYCPVRMVRFKPEPGVIACGIGWDWLSIYANSKFDFLIEGSLEPLDSIGSEVFHQYMDNIEQETNVNSWPFTNVTISSAEMNILRMEDHLENYSDTFYCRIVISRSNQQIRWMKKYHSMVALHSGCEIHLKVRGKEHRIVSYYSILDQIQLGVFKARSETFSEWNYLQLYANRQFDKLNFIHAQMPDLITDFEDQTWEVAPVIEELLPIPELAWQPLALSNVMIEPQQLVNDTIQDPSLDPFELEMIDEVPNEPIENDTL
ncbi:MAG: hypothetical protein ACI857_002258 [Arenicella sp.]|jgi:hypothetical protein